MKTALTIAGSDSSGGAGIQADLKTMTMNGVFGMSAITALTAQNTTGVTGIFDVTPEFLQQQIDAVFTDIYPDAVKIGMVSTSALIEAITERLTHYQAHNIVVDPVMVATSGAKLICDDAIETLKRRLLPLATVITPNIPEAEELAGFPISSEADMETAARTIAQRYGCAVLCKGGHNLNDANDYLFTPAPAAGNCAEDHPNTSVLDRSNAPAESHAGTGRWFAGKRIDNPNTHGTGCTLSSAIASNLAKGYPLEQAVCRAKSYISGALGAMLNLGAGSGPMNHAFNLTGEFALEAN